MLRTVAQRPGCSAWALSVLTSTPEGVARGAWLDVLERELPALAKAGKVKGTLARGESRVRWWPARAEIPSAAGEVCT